MGEQANEEIETHPTTHPPARKVSRKRSAKKSAQPKRAKTRQSTRRQRTQQRQEQTQQSNEFMDAFGGPVDNREREYVREREKEVFGTECSLRNECRNKSIPGYQKCYRCSAQIHHLCAISNSWTDPDNELNVFCSQTCKDTL